MKNMHYAILFLLLGFIGCGGIPKLSVDPESRDFYEYARLIMTKQEKDIFNHLPDSRSRHAFIQDFWTKRDPDPETETNEFQEEFMRRIDYATRRFKEGTPGWKTDRGRIYIYFGPPDRIERRPMINNIDIKGYQIWIYYRYNFGIEFIDSRGDGTYRFDPHTGILGSFYDALEQAQMGLNWRNDDFEKILMDFSLKHNRPEHKFVVTIPTRRLAFTAVDGLLKADFEFQFYVYPAGKDKAKKIFRETRHFEIQEQKLPRMEHITFDFNFDLAPGKYYFDVIITGKPDLGKTRKIFNVKIK